MLEQALRVACDGNYVVIAVANKKDSHNILNRLAADHRVIEVIPTSQKAHTEHSGEISLILPDDFDMRRGVPPHAHPSVRTFTDHAAVEQYLREQGGWAWQQFVEMVERAG